jgi:hypothetical protein
MYVLLACGMQSEGKRERQKEKNKKKEKKNAASRLTRIPEWPQEASGLTSTLKMTI